MKKVFQVALLIILLLLSMFGLFVIFSVVTGKGLSIFEEPSFSFFTFEVLLCIVSALYKLQSTRHLRNTQSQSRLILDSTEFTVPDPSFPKKPKRFMVLYLAYILFGICCFANVVYILELSDYDFLSPSKSLKADVLAFVAVFGVLGSTFLLDSWFMRPSNKNLDP